MAERAHIERLVGTGDQPHRARIVAANGEKIAALTEHYVDQRDVEHALLLTLEALLHDLDPDDVRVAVDRWLQREQT